MMEGTLTARVAHCLDAIDEARAGGAMWQDIGDLFGVTRQTACITVRHAKKIRLGIEKLQRQFEQEPLPPVGKK